VRARPVIPATSAHRLRSPIEEERACGFVEVRDLWFRSHYVFVVIHLETRQLLHAASTLAPTTAWTVQQLRDLTPFGIGPKFLLRDNDGKFTLAFDAIAVGAGLRLIRTPVLAPKANAVQAHRGSRLQSAWSGPCLRR
jgi:hypothetical protein